MFKPKSLLVVIFAVAAMFLISQSVMAQGKGSGKSGDSAKGKATDTMTEAKGQGQATADQAKQQTQQKLQKKEQKKLQKKEQKKLQKKEQKKLQKKEQKQDCDEAQKKTGEQKGKSEDGKKGQGKGQAKAAEGTDSAEKIAGKGKVVKTEDGFAIECGDKLYKPLNLQEKYQKEGLEIDFTADAVSGEDVAENTVSIVDISSGENVETAPVASEEQAKDGEILQQKAQDKKQQGKGKLANDL